MSALKVAGIADPPVFTHPALTNMKEGMPELAKFGAAENVGLAKNMFLKGKKGELVLVLALVDTKTDLKTVGKAIGSASLRFAPAEVLESALGVVQGAVTPLALVNDAAKAVLVVLDKALLASDKLIAVHPCRNDKSVLLTSGQIEAFIKTRGNTVYVVDFAPESSAAPTEPSVTTISTE